MVIVGFLAPMLLIAFFVKITSREPINFKQKRVGKNKKLFNIYKFRATKHYTADFVTVLFSFKNLVRNAGAQRVSVYG